MRWITQHLLALPRDLLLSQRSTWVYNARVWHKRLMRFGHWACFGHLYATQQLSTCLPYRYTQHRSQLIRPGLHPDPRYAMWQKNKVTNLQQAILRLNGCIIRPGQRFSFWRVVGRPTSRRGFLEGMEISRGQPRPGIGGGLCQLANLLNWMAWHTPLRIIQRSLHSYDPFPDQGRVLPFGSGAAVFWNYVDWQVVNPTSHTFQLRVWIQDNTLRGEIRCDAPAAYRFSVHEKNHFFTHHQGTWYRSNEIWVSVFQRQSDGHPGKHLHDKLMVKNWSKVCYEPDLTRYEVRPYLSSPQI